MKLIDKLKKLHPDSSASQIKKWILNGRVHLNNAIEKKPHCDLSDNDKVEIVSKAPPIKSEIEVLYRDSEVIVIAKPQGLLSVAHDTKLIPNVHDILKRELKPSRVFPVHRLDRETSGILVFALNEKARDHLKEQFFNHTIKRQYRAILQGQLSPSEGTWISRLVEDKNLVVRSTRSKRGKTAITHFTVKSQSAKLSEVIFTLETGRKNQIRVQSADMGHPIVGDKKYGATSNPIGRLGLHAETLEFDHPDTGKRKCFYYPPEASFNPLAKSRSLDF